jgi:hypothetical protein
VANLVLAFGELVAGGVLIDAAVKGASIPDVIRGVAGSAPTTSSTVASTGGATSSTTPAPSLAGIPTTQGPAGTSVPLTSWNPLHKPIADWIIPVLQWASEHGWTGTVTSGYRTYAQQAQINASGAYSATAGTSNHETTSYPGGAVDVSDPTGLEKVLAGYTGIDKLIGGVLGAVDPEHFSASGH